MSEMSIEDQAKLVVRLAQSWWFAREIDHHPLTKYAQQNSIHINRLALAQHYEIPTGYLDITHSFDVAAFFATCRRTSSGWEPVGESATEPGIVYRVEMDRVENALEIFQALGPQPLPRPYEQRAWVTELPLVDSFDGWPAVFILQFQHEASVGRHFLDKFAGGEDLFPPDPLADIAHEITSCGEIPSELIESAIKSFSEDKFGCVPRDFAALRIAVARGHSLIDYRRLMTDEKLVPFVDQFERLKKRLAETRLTIRPVRVEPINEQNDSAPETV
jgi:hypothetical protein